MTQPRSRRRRSAAQPGSAPNETSQANPADYAEAGFVPSRKQVAYLLALEDALARRQPSYDAAICASLGMSRFTLARWRQTPAFLAWFVARLNRTSDETWRLIVRRQELNAIQGSVESAEFIARIRQVGAYAQRPGSVGGPGEANLLDLAKHYTVHRLVTRPDDVASTKTLPFDHPAILEAEARR
jgi:hypothetical protein